MQYPFKHMNLMFKWLYYVKGGADRSLPLSGKDKIIVGRKYMYFPICHYMQDKNGVIMPELVSQ